MARLDEFYIVTDVERKVFLPKAGAKMRLVGKCYGRDSFKDGEVIVTSVVDHIEYGIAYTMSGSKYELQNKSKDFIELEKASASKDCIVIDDWQLMEDGKEIILAGFSDEKFYQGVVTSQKGNYVTLDKKQKCFVIWPNINPMASSRVSFYEKLMKLGIPYPDGYEDAWLLPNIRPRIFGRK